MTARDYPTRRQLEVLRAYIATGSIAAAAYELGISETTARQHLSGLYRRMGCLNAAQAAYLLGQAERGGAATTTRPEPPPPSARASLRLMPDRGLLSHHPWDVGGVASVRAPSGSGRTPSSRCSG